MKEYPSIERATGSTFVEFKAYVFDKIDGNNLRFEWSKKQGWHKFGSKYSMFDHTHPQYAGSIPLFMETLAEPLTRIAVDNRWDRLVAFAEYWNEGGLAGQHMGEDGLLHLAGGRDMKLSLFDLAPLRQGSILGPKEFLKLCEGLPIPRLVGHVNFTRGYVEQVWRGEIEGITREGVVAKAKESRGDLLMAKAKTKVWIDAIHAAYKPEDAKLLINS